MNDVWVHQHKDFGLGNWINLTCTIQLMAEHFGKPVKVYFDLAFIRECFLDCEFMEILDEQPEEPALFGSNLINYKNNCPDYLHVYKEITKRIPLSGELPHTYVDQAKEIDVPKYNTVFIRGSGSEEKYYISLKMPHDSYYQEYFNKNLTGEYKQAFVGSEGDIVRSSDLFKSMPLFIGDVRKALALIREADFVVANDSGLAHAAAAMKKNMIILWKNTSLPKNANPNKNCVYRMCH